MRVNILNRKVHYWAGFVVALPVLVMIASGLLLQMKKHWAFVQPPEHRGTASVPAVDLEGILTAVTRLPQLGVRGWEDVNRLDVRPARGVVKVWLNNGWEVQVDLADGRVLHTAYRRSDAIESIHDGSFFGGEWVKLGMFLPAGVGLLGLWVTGMWMWWAPIAARRRRAAKDVSALRAGNAAEARPA